MAMRLLVSICCIVTSSAAGGVWSESQFKTKYDAYVLDKDSAAVKTANANIVGEAIPAVPLTEAETDMHRWYHDVNAAVQADAKATMDKALADRLAHGNYPTADCMTKIDLALNEKETWAQIHPVYLSATGEVVQAETIAAAAKAAAEAAPADADLAAAAAAAAAAAKACACVHALGGAEKELAIKAGFQSKLMALFKKKMDAALTPPNHAPLTMTMVSHFVTGTLAAAVPTLPATATGKETQPMYSSADATLRGEMMHAMVNQLNGKLPAV